MEEPEEEQGGVEEVQGKRQRGGGRGGRKGQAGLWVRSRGSLSIQEILEAGEVPHARQGEENHLPSDHLAVEPGGRRGQGSAREDVKDHWGCSLEVNTHWRKL